MAELIFIATGWGAINGGVNAFNQDLCLGLARIGKVAGHRVGCVVPRADAAAISDAHKGGDVELLSLDAEDPESFEKTSAVDLVNRVRASGFTQVTWWIGHDLHSGPMALKVREVAGGKAVVVLHTNPLAYKVFEGGDPKRAIKKERQQRELLAAADVVAAVGPKLVDAAHDLLLGTGKESVDLVPGMASIAPLPEGPRQFKAMTFGRLDSRSDRIKQGRLAVAAFAHAQRNLHHDFGADPMLTIVGVDSEHAVEITRFAEERAGRLLPVYPLPFNTDRAELYDDLRRQSVALMLSVHEGFGLAGWEAIAAGVPLIASSNSGLARLIKERFGGSGLGCQFVDVHGSSNEPREKDLEAVAKALWYVAREPRAARENVTNLRRLCIEAGFTWATTARKLATACGILLPADPHEAFEKRAASVRTFGLPASLGEHFCGRERELTELHQSLQDRTAVALTGTTNAVCAHGDGGIGKSRLAIEYAWRHIEEYPGGIFYAVVQSRGPIEVLAEFGRYLEPLLVQDDGAAEHLLLALGRTREQTLLILDDVSATPETSARFEQMTQLRGQIIPPLPRLPHVTVLLTTRYRELSGAWLQSIGRLNDTDAIELLLDCAGRPIDSLAPDEQSAARGLAVGDLGGHPLALSLAGAWLRKVRSSTLAAYRARLGEKGIIDSLEEAARRAGAAITDHERSIVKTYEITRQQLNKTDPIDGLAWMVLGLAAELAPTVPIDRRLLLGSVQQLEPARTAEELDLALDRLLGLSLLNEFGADGEVAVHALVGEYVRWSFRRQGRYERGRSLDAVANGFRTMFPPLFSEFWRTLEQNVGGGSPSLAIQRHVEHVFLAIENNDASHGAASLGILLLLLYHYRGAYRLARQAVESAERHCRDLHDRYPESAPAKFYLANFLGAKSSILIGHGDVLSAEIAARESIDVHRSILTIDDSPVHRHNVIRAQARLSGVLLGQKKYSKAAVDARKARAEAIRLEMVDSAVPGLRQTILQLYLHEGDALRGQNDIGAALRTFLLARKLAEAEARESPDNPDVQHDLELCATRIGEVLLIKGDRQGAIEELRAALKVALSVAERMKESVHARTSFAAALGNLAEVLSTGTPEEQDEAGTLIKQSVQELRDLNSAGRLTAEQRDVWLPQNEKLLQHLNDAHASRADTDK